MSNDKKKHEEVSTTGHEWDGIQEYNNPLPRWWVWVFYACVVFAIGYSVAYPAWPMIHRATPGLLGFSTRAEVQKEIDRVNAENGPIEAQLASADMTTLSADPELYNYAIQSGRATFATYCSQCHGSGAAGAKGYPNLLDNDWLWGGDIESIVYTVTHGVRNTEDEEGARFSQMPAFGTDELLTKTEIAEVANYVRSLSGLEADPEEAAAGQQIFADNCVACHMEDGTGDRAQGAPNLTDAIWLYGSDLATIESNISVGPFGVMPAWGKNPNFDQAKINAVAAYVHQLGGGE